MVGVFGEAAIGAKGQGKGHGPVVKGHGLITAGVG